MLDWAQLLVALLTGLISCGTSLLVCIFNNNAQNNKTRTEIEKTILALELQNKDLYAEVKELKAEVKENNQIKIRLTKIETEVEILKKLNTSK